MRAAKPDILITVGEPLPCGAYILRLKVSQKIQVVFGRLRGGEPVEIEAGDYLYVGSAMGVKGSATLGRRLLRHATRSGTLPCHKIRPALCNRLAADELTSAGIEPPQTKQLRWHIDYLLDRRACEIIQVVAVCSRQRQETEIARRLAAMDGIAPLIPGIGASDSTNASHLFRAGQGLLTNSWWRRFVAGR